MNTPVSFELAKLLKEKGFEQNLIKYINQATINGTLVFPTIADVAMWLYEKHGIWITVCVIGADGFGYWLHNKNRERLNSKDQGGYWHSPTEAYEAAIEYTLKFLIK